jgi:hypothetical protein
MGSGSTIVAAVTTGSRFASVIATGIVRIGGTGSMRISPRITANQPGTNSVTINSNAIFKVRRVGNNGVTTIGTWTT